MRRSSRRDLSCSSTAPIWRWRTTLRFQDLSEDDFLKRAAFHVEVLNDALRNVPADRARIHICWGNYEGPHDHDIPFAKVAPILVKAKPHGAGCRGRQSAARA